MYKKTGIILASLLLLITIQSITYFFLVLKISFIEWLFFNACAPSNLLFLAGFIVYLTSGNRIILHTAIIPMFFFAITGLFIFPWDGFNIVSQICHFLMLLNIAWTLFVTLKTEDYKAAAVGITLGMIVSVFIGFQQNYVMTHKSDLKRLMQVEIKD
jgi:hypothetical protein